MAPYRVLFFTFFHCLYMTMTTTPIDITAAQREAVIKAALSTKDVGRDYGHLDESVHSAVVDELTALLEPSTADDEEAIFDYASKICYENVVIDVRYTA